MSLSRIRESPRVYPPMLHACLMGRRGHLGSEACCSRCCPPPPPKSLLPSKVLFSTQLLSKSLAPLLLLLLLLLGRSRLLFLSPLLPPSPLAQNPWAKREGSGVCQGREKRAKKAGRNERERATLSSSPPLYRQLRTTHCMREKTTMQARPKLSIPSPPKKTRQESL